MATRGGCGPAIDFGVDEDQEICLCFHVSLRKIRGYLRREDPEVASLISECLGAGTGCGWCVPILEHLHAQHRAGTEPRVGFSPGAYAEARRVYRVTHERRDMLGGEEGEAPGSRD